MANISLKLNQGIVEDDPELVRVIEELLILADATPQKNQIVTTKDLNHALELLQKKISLTSSKKSNSSIRGQSTKGQSILVIGSVGLINAQLKILLGNNGHSVSIVNNIDTAIEVFKNKDFEKIVIDLFMPTETEGFEALDTLKRTAIMVGLNIEFIILSNPRKDSLLNELATGKGASYFINKEEGWHKALLDALEGKGGAS